MADIDKIVSQVDFVFCAVDMKKEEIRALEEAYATAGVPGDLQQLRPPRHARTCR